MCACAGTHPNTKKDGQKEPCSTKHYNKTENALMSKCLCLCNDLCVKKQTWVFEHFRSESSPRRPVITVGLSK